MATSPATAMSSVVADADADSQQRPCQAMLPMPPNVADAGEGQDGTDAADPDPLRQETPDPDPLQQETSSGYSTAPSTDPRDEDDSDAVDDVQHDVGSSEVEEEQSPETDHDLLSQETLPLPGPMNSWSSPAPSTEPWSPGSELPDIVVLDPPPTPSPPRPPRRSLRRSFSSFGNDDDKTPPSKRKRDD
jgi:hypothetical protein